jgi:uncharacterized surface protein with fasciclin (FAS1) repeats
VKSLYQEILVLGATGSLRILAEAFDVIGFAELLKADDYFTIFAPTDAAFAKLPANYLEELQLNPDHFAVAFRYHIAPGKILSSELAHLKSIRNLLNEELLVEEKDGLLIDEARIIQPDILRSNGVIHIIDTVLTIKKRRKIRAGRHCQPSPHQPEVLKNRMTEY